MGDSPGVRAALPDKRFAPNRRASPVATRRARGPLACPATPWQPKGAGVADGGASVRERVLAAVPELDDLPLRGRPGEQVRSEPLAVGGDETSWLVWVRLQNHRPVIAAPRPRP